MPVTYTIDPAERVVYLAAIGGSTVDEWLDALRDVLSDPAFETGFDFVSDRRRATPPGREFVERWIGFVREHARQFGHCRWAAIVANPATDMLTLAVQQGPHLTDIEVAYFSDPAEARAWVLRP